MSSLRVGFIIDVGQDGLRDDLDVISEGVVVGVGVDDPINGDHDGTLRVGVVTLEPIQMHSSG